MPLTRRRFALFALSAAAGAQSLAHPGWRGNGIAPETWWKHATFVRMAPDSTFTQAAATLDLVTAVGADSLLLPDLQPRPDAPFPFDSRFGTEDELDAVLREASARRLHILVRIPVARLLPGGGELRFWMNRGVAGVDAHGATATDAEALRSVRSALGRFPGQRVLLAPSAAGDGATLRVADATAVEAGGGAGMAADVIEVDQTDGPQEARSPLSALVPLLLTDARPILDCRLLVNQAQREAVASVFHVRSTQPVYRAGRNLKPQPVGPTGGEVRAWLLRNGAGAAPLLLLSNASAAPQPLLPILTQAGVASRYIVPVLRSDGRAGPLTVASDALPPGAVVLGTLFGSAPSGRRGRPKR